MRMNKLCILRFTTMWLMPNIYHYFLYEGDQKVIFINKWNHIVAGHMVAGHMVTGTDDAEFK